MKVLEDLKRIWRVCFIEKTIATWVWEMLKQKFLHTCLGTLKYSVVTFAAIPTMLKGINGLSNILLQAYFCQSVFKWDISHYIQTHSNFWSILYILFYICMYLKKMKRKQKLWKNNQLLVLSLAFQMLVVLTNLILWRNISLITVSLYLSEPYITLKTVHYLSIIQAF